jgi:hypothetical protein
MTLSLNDGLHFIRRRHRDNGKLQRSAETISQDRR